MISFCDKYQFRNIYQAMNNYNSCNIRNVGLLIEICSKEHDWSNEDIFNEGNLIKSNRKNQSALIDKVFSNLKWVYLTFTMNFLDDHTAGR